MKNIRVLIVNDSIMIQQHLRRIIAADPELKVVGIAGDGEEAVRLAQESDPDVVLMDIRMPNQNGVEATREIMRTNPLPIIIVTATMRTHMSYIYDCLALGALEAVKTPSLKQDVTSSDSGSHSAENTGAALLLRIHVLASLKKTVMEKFSERQGMRKNLKPPLDTPQVLKSRIARKVVIIGASTGGPTALLDVLLRLPADLKAAVLLVQHIDPEFAEGLADWLSSSSRKNVRAAREDDLMQEGHIYLASLQKHLVIHEARSLSYEEAKQGEIHVPSIDITFRSAARHFGKNAIGVLLTGMGSDGAKGLKIMREAGARTIAQDEATSLIYGMPRAAREINAAEFILPLDKIAGEIAKLIEA